MTAVWVLLIERGVAEGSDVRLFWHQDAAGEAARSYVAAHWPSGRHPPGEVEELIESYNGLTGVDEHVYLGAMEVQGNEYFPGDVDHRPRCSVCGEPTVLADDNDPESWVHAADANDWADHTAEVERPPGTPAPTERGEET